MIVIITCGQDKAITKSRAEKMYTSGYFRQCLRWAKAKTSPDKVFILSAKYGLLRLDDLIMPYDLKMGQSGSVLPSQVYEQAKALGIENEKILSTAGIEYRKILDTVFPNISYPFDGMTIGYRAEAMKKDLGC